MAANREGVGNIKPVRALCPFYCVCNTCIHIYIYIAHGSGAHSRSLAWSSGGLRGTDVPLPGRLPGPALVGPLQGPLRVLGPPGGIRPGPAALAPRSRARRDSSAAAALPRREELRAEPRPLLAVGSDSGEGGGQENCRGEEEEAEGGQGRGPVAQMADAAQDQGRGGQVPPAGGSGRPFFRIRPPPSPPPPPGADA